jgi:hypothetical protein
MSQMKELRCDIAFGERSDCNERYNDHDSRKLGALSLL